MKNPNRYIITVLDISDQVKHFLFLFLGQIELRIPLAGT